MHHSGGAAVSASGVALDTTGALETPGGRGADDVSEAVSVADSVAASVATSTTVVGPSVGPSMGPSVGPSVESRRFAMPTLIDQLIAGSLVSIAKSDTT